MTERCAMPSLASTIDCLAPHLPPALVPLASLDRLTSVAATLPAALSAWTYLECRLGEDSEQVDLIVEVGSATRGILLGENDVLAIHPEYTSDATWQRVVAVCDAWKDTRGLLHDRVERVWLEFDVDARPSMRAPTLPVPGIFVDFVNAPFLLGPTADRLALLEAVVQPMSGEPITPALRAQLHRCLDALPSEATLVYVGMLPSRGTNTVRVCVRGIDDAALPGYLACAGWCGAGDELSALLHDLAATGDAASLRSVAITHIDVSARGVEPRIGLEVGFARPQRSGRLVETRFLDWLVARSLCTPAKRDGLSAWPGVLVERLPHQLWPSTVTRRVNHVKLLFAPGRPLEAKGYLCAFHAPRRIERCGTMATNQSVASVPALAPSR